MKVTKTKTRFDIEALNLAVYLDSHFHFLQEKTIDLTPKNTLAKKIQSYLDKKHDRIEDNKLLGIIGIHDNFRNHTGGRIHLIAGMQGPLIESIQKQVVEHPIDYEIKHKLLVKAVQIASGVKAPKVGNIHFHLFHCNTVKVKPGTLLELIRKDHGFQNDVQQIATSSLYIMMNLRNKPYWRPNVDTEMVDTLFGA